MRLARTTRRRKGKTTDETPATEVSSDSDKSATAGQAQQMVAYAHHQDKPAVSLRGGAAQAKLNISQDNDPYEVEADAVAAQVTSGPSNQAEPISDSHPEASAERETQVGPVVQRKQSESTSSVGTGNTFSNQSSSNVNTAGGRTSGQALPAATRAQMESALAQDFSQVRVHTDQQDNKKAESIDAQAFTVGQDIVFGAGQYSPETSRGRQLLAHELTHVVQQSGNRDGNASSGEAASPPAIQRQSTRRGAAPAPPPRVTAAQLMTPVPPERGVQSETRVRRWLQRNRLRFMFSTQAQVVAAVRSALPNESAPLSDEAIASLAHEVGITFLPAASVPAPARPPLSESGPQADTPAPDAGIEPSMVGSVATAIASHRDVNRALRNAAPAAARPALREMERRGTGESLTRPPPEEESPRPSRPPAPARQPPERPHDE